MRVKAKSSQRFGRLRRYFATLVAGERGIVRPFGQVAILAVAATWLFAGVTGNHSPRQTMSGSVMAGGLQPVENVPQQAGRIAPTVTCPSFNDVPPNDPFFPFICSIAEAGITAGCGGGDYCPNDSATRAQMAVFLLRAEHGSTFTPPPCTPPGTFGDVPCPGAFAVDWIDQLALEGVTGGCGGGDYCPNSPNTRAQMAVFLVKTFNLVTPTPTPTPPATETPTITLTPAITLTPTPAVKMVTIGNDFFSPASVTVRVGDTVQWNWNSGGVGHSTTSGPCLPCNPDGHWDSGVMSSGSFSHKFTAGDAGTRPYYCRIHTTIMTGTITVNH